MTFDAMVEQLQKVVEEFPYLIPRRFAANSYTLDLIRRNLPERSCTEDAFSPLLGYSTFYGIDIEVDDTLPNGIIKEVSD